MKKDYNSQYLQNTQDLLIELKKSSYAPFLNIDSGTIADIGCGTGEDAIRLADLLPKSVNVLGLDHDPNLIQLANQKQGELSLSNLSFKVQELDQVDSDQYQFQGIRAERVMQHLKNPKKIIDSVYNMLNKEGIFLIVETDWAGLNLYDSSTSEQTKFVNYLTDKKVNNGLASRNTIPLLKNAGFKNVQLFITPFVLDSLDVANLVIKLEESIGEAAEFSYLSMDEKTSYISELRNLNNEGLFRCHMNMVQIQASK